MSKKNDGKPAEKEIAETFRFYFMQKTANAVKVETQYRVAWIPDKRPGGLGKPTKQMVRIKQNLDDFVGCLIPSGRMLFIGVKSDEAKSLGIGLKNHGIKEDQLRNLLKWAKLGAICRVLWKREGIWRQLPASIIQAAAVRGGPVSIDELDDLGLRVDTSNGFVDFLSLSEEVADELLLPPRSRRRRPRKGQTADLGLGIHPLPAVIA